MRLNFQKINIIFIVLLIFSQSSVFTGSFFDLIPGKSKTAKFQNGMLFLLVAYNTFEVAVRRLAKYHKAKQNKPSLTNSNLNSSSNSVIDSDEENPVEEFVDNVLGDLGIVTQEKLAEYIEQLLSNKYPYLVKEELVKLVSFTVDQKLTGIIERISKLEKN